LFDKASKLLTKESKTDSDCHNGGTWKRGRPWKRWTDEVDENCDNMGIKKIWYTVAKDKKE
jgi:hypothetical protein